MISPLHGEDKLSMRHEPIDGTAQAINEFDLRLVFEKMNGTGDVGKRVANIAGTRLRKFRFDIRRHYVRQIGDEIEQRILLTTGTIENSLLRQPLNLAGKQIGGDDILNKGEVACLLAVAVNCWLLLVAHEVDKLGNHGRILRIRILTRPEYIELAENDGLQPVKPVEHRAIYLTCKL